MKKAGITDIAMLHTTFRAGAIPRAVSAAYGNGRAARRYRARKAKKNKTNKQESEWWL